MPNGNGDDKMNQEIFTDALVNAGTAYENGNYELSYEWFQKALNENPESVDVLSKIGAVCVLLDKYDEAFDSFQKAIDLDPDNGENYFNMGNAYFFKGEYTKSLDMYAQSLVKGLNDEIKPRVYYQMALICTVRGDAKAAITNFKKFEESDSSRTASLDPEIIEEKIKVYLMDDDIDEAEKLAVELVNLDPSSLSSYMVYYNIVLAKGDYKKAESIVAEAEKYAQLDASDTFALNTEKISMLNAKADAEPENAKETIDTAIGVVNGLLKIAPPLRKKELTLILAELYMKLQDFDKAISIASTLSNNGKVEEFVPNNVEVDGSEPGDEEIDNMADEDMQKIDDMIASGEIDDNMGEFAEVYYDESGNEVREYSDDLSSMILGDETEEPVSEESTEQPAIEDLEELSEDFNDRLNFVLLTSYAAKEDYENTRRVSGYLKNSSNLYYAYFARYTEAFAASKLPRYSRAEVEMEYAEVNAFFRTAMLNREGTSFAAVFRARMYAEVGKFAKAEEMANLLDTNEKQAVMEYINSCRSAK